MEVFRVLIDDATLVGDFVSPISVEVDSACRSRPKRLDRGGAQRQALSDSVERQVVHRQFDARRLEVAVRQIEACARGPDRRNQGHFMQL
jgi:hypothetical protein